MLFRSEEIQNVEMEGHVARSEALGLERLIERIDRDRTAVHREEHLSAIRILPEAHVITEPAFDAAALVVVAARAKFGVLVPATEAVDIELPHIFTNAAEVLDQLVVWQWCHPLSGNEMFPLFVFQQHFKISF